MDGSRRSFFSQLGRSLAADVLSAVDTVQSRLANRITPNVEGSPPHPWLRPPGALPEPQFLSTCTRCTACQEVCPYRSIRRLGPEFGDALGTPAVIPDESPCFLCEDLPCIAACEPGALRPVARKLVNMGLAVIDSSKCYVTQGQPCDYCVTRCPLGAEAIRLDDRRVPNILDSGCTGCGVCAYLCPGRAIAIAPQPTGAHSLASAATTSSVMSALE